MTADPIEIDSPPALSVATARKAQRDTTSLPVRLTRVRRFRQMLAERAESVAEEVTQSLPQRGGLVAETLVTEVLPVLDACRFLEKNARSLLKPRRLGVRGRPIWLAGVRGWVSRDPWGVVLILAPGNYPFMLPGIQMLQALAAGNVVLLKPGRDGVVSAKLLVNLAHEAGFTQEEVQQLDDTVETAEHVIDASVDHVVLTGSAETGRAVLRRCAETLTPTTMELSGCDTMVVLPGADIELVADALAFGMRLNASQTCIAPRAALVHESLESTLRKAAEARGLQVPAITPPIDEDRFEPVFSVTVFKTPSEAEALVQGKDYALGCSVFGPVDEAEAFAERCPVGCVTVNDLIAPTADPRVPFGGRGRSGFGVTQGAEGLLGMTQPKALLSRRGKSRPHLEPAHDADTELFLSYIRAAHGRSLGDRFGAARRLIRAAQRRARPPRTEDAT